MVQMGLLKENLSPFCPGEPVKFTKPVGFTHLHKEDNFLAKEPPFDPDFTLVILFVKFLEVRVFLKST